VKLVALMMLIGLSVIAQTTNAGEGWWMFGSGDAAAKKGAGMRIVAKQVSEFEEAPDFVVGGLAFGSDNSVLAVNGMVAGPEVHLWNWHSPKRPIRILEMKSSAGGGRAIRYSPDGTLLAVGHVRDRTDMGAGVIRIWRTNDWSVAHDIQEPLGGTGDAGLDFDPTGHLLFRTLDRISGPNVMAHRTDDWEQAWAISTGSFVPKTLSASPDGKFLAVAGYTFNLGPTGPPIVTHPRILVINTSTHLVERTINAFPDNNEIQAVTWNVDGTGIAAGAIVGGSFAGPDAVRIFEASSGRLVASEPTSDLAYVSALAYSRDGRWFVDGYVDGAIRIWNGKHSEILQKIDVDIHFHPALCISHDSRYLAIAVGRKVSVWSIE